MPLSPFRPLMLTERNALRLRESGLRVAVTGASGWLGQATLEMLESVFLGCEFEEQVVAFGSWARSLVLRSGREVTLTAFDDLPELPRAPTLLFHYAFLTKDKTFELAPTEYQRRVTSIRRIVSDALPRIGVTHLLLPSSGAVYGLPTSSDRSLCADPVLNPYGTQKIEDERHYLHLCRELGVRVAIPRVFNLAGPYINKHGAYALSSIVNAALAEGSIMLRASKRVIRDYTSICDLVNVSVGWLLREIEVGETIFDTGIGEPVEISELASRILKVMGCTGFRIERPVLSAGPDDRYLGDYRPFIFLAAELGVTLSDLNSQIRDTVEYLAPADCKHDG